jgi:hypothetical protein
MSSKFPNVVVPDFFLLVDTGVVVGVRKQVAFASFFSKDGKSWSSTPIPFESEWTSSPLLSTSAQRLYAGQLVSLPDTDTSFVIVRLHQQTFFWDLRKDKLLQVTTVLRSEGLHPASLQVTGNIYNNLSLLQRWETLKQRHALSEKPSVVELLSLSLGWLLGAALLVAFQWNFQTGIGPLWTTAGGTLGAGFYFWWKQKTHIGWLRRAFMLTLSFRHALLLSLVSMLAYLPLLWSAKGMEEARRQPLKALLLFGVAMFLVSLLTTVLIGDTVAWWTQDGYQGEEEEAFNW